jgi:hypothetical protein
MEVREAAEVLKRAKALFLMLNMRSMGRGMSGALDVYTEQIQRANNAELLVTELEKELDARADSQLRHNFRSEP